MSEIRIIICLTHFFTQTNFHVSLTNDNLYGIAVKPVTILQGKMVKGKPQFDGFSSNNFVYVPVSISCIQICSCSGRTNSEPFSAIEHRLEDLLSVRYQYQYQTHLYRVNFQFHTGHLHQMSFQLKHHLKISHLQQGKALQVVKCYQCFPV